MFLYSQWCELPLTTRIKIADKFGIQKTGSTHVQDNVVVSDGYNMKEVEKYMSQESITSFIGCDFGNIDQNWTAFLEKIEKGDVSVEDSTVSDVEEVKEVVKKVTKKEVKPAKKAAKNAKNKK